MSAALTPQQYYEGDEALLGGYQYIPLSEVIQAIEFQALDDDSYLKSIKRSQIVYHARMGVKELSKRAANRYKKIEITVPTNLVWTMPQDYVDYVRVSVVVTDFSTGGRKLMPLDINRNINTATGYLQDNNYQIMFDDDGDIITADSANAYARAYRTYQFCEGGGQFNLDTSKLSQYGEFTIDEDRGKILFSSQLSDQEIVLEYITDGLEADLSDSEIRIHKNIEECLKDYIYEACISKKRTVPANEKHRARQRYKTTLHQSKIDQSDFNLLEISRVMRKKSMTL